MSGEPSAIADRTPLAGSGRAMARRPFTGAPFTGASLALLSRLGARAMALGFLIVLAHHQSIRTFASYNYLLVLASTVGVILDTGVGLVANREVAGGRLDLASAYRAALPTQVATSALAAAAVAVLGLLLPGPVTHYWAVLWTAIFIFFIGLFDGQAELLRGAGRPWVEASLQLLAAILQVGLGVAVILSGLGLAALMAVLALKQALVVGIAQLWLPTPRRGRDPELWRVFLRRGLWLGAATTFGVIAGRSAQLALGNLASPIQVARFAVATRYLDLATMLCATAAFGLLPAMADRATCAPLLQRQFLRRLLVGAPAAALALAALLAPIVPWLTVTIFGERYRGAVPASEIFVACLPLLMLSSIAWYALIAERRERWVTLAAGVGAAIGGVAVVWIALRPTALAAAGATVVGLTATALLLLGSLRRRGRRPARSPAPAGVRSL
jgi:O-antigen/teichoic acid export membrane protein